jgi:hypothetical protein
MGCPRILSIYLHTEDSIPCAGGFKPVHLSVTKAGWGYFPLEGSESPVTWDTHHSYGCSLISQHQLFQFTAYRLLLCMLQAVEGRLPWKSALLLELCHVWWRRPNSRIDGWRAHSFHLVNWMKNQVDFGYIWPWLYPPLVILQCFTKRSV